MFCISPKLCLKIIIWKHIYCRYAIGIGIYLMTLPNKKYIKQNISTLLCMHDECLCRYAVWDYLFSHFTYEFLHIYSFACKNN